MGLRILVTGGAGFIGSHTVRQLLARGHRVVIVDNLSMGSRSNVPAGAGFIEGDVLDEALMDDILATHRIQKVCHLAARVSIRASTSGFCEDARVNVMGTLSVLRSILRRDVAGVVFASSMAVYADSDRPVPLSEEYPARPISPYGISKLAGEQFVENIAGGGGRQWTVLRLFNTYGPGQTYTPYVGVMTIFATRLLRSEPPVIFGGGEQVRDFVYVGDVARAFVLALERESGSGVYNIGSGRPRSVNEIARLLRERIDPSIAPAEGPRCPGEIANSLADISRARRSLGFEPRGRLEDRIDEVVESVKAAIAAGSAAPAGRVGP